MACSSSLSWDNGKGSTFFATTGVTIENRTGGTMPALGLPSGAGPYREALETRKFDVGVVGQVVGAALEREGYRATDLPRFDFSYTVPGVFVNQTGADPLPAVAAVRRGAVE